MPKRVYGLTFTELIGMANEVINKIHAEGYRNVSYPGMGGKGTKKLVKQQRENVDKTAKLTWDQMFPEKKRDGKSKRQKELEERYGVSFEGEV